MSVILESLAGDTFVCIQEFYAPPDGERPCLETDRKFRVGERPRYVSARQHPNTADQPTGWFVVFDAADGKRYAATQTYFVTEECWLGIKRYFAKRLLRESGDRPGTITPQPVTNP